MRQRETYARRDDAQSYNQFCKKHRPSRNTRIYCLFTQSETETVAIYNCKWNSEINMKSLNYVHNRQTFQLEAVVSYSHVAQQRV